MNPSFFSKILVLLLVLSSIYGVFLFSKKDQDINAPYQCNIMELQECSLINAGQKVSVQFQQFIELEEELNIRITLSKPEILHQTWVQGENMYMGKTALLVESAIDEGVYRVYPSKLFLGACSEPDMKWQLVVQTKDSEQNIQSYFFNFETHF